MASKKTWSEFLQIEARREFSPIVDPDFYEFENEVKTTRYIHSSSAARNLLTEWMDSLPKVCAVEEQLSNECREKGNIKFRKRDTASILEAAQLYTEAICVAPPNTRALALAHGNRAATLYKLEEFEVAYNDCQCALDLDHPKPDVMLLRQATIARSMSNATKFEACIDKMENLKLGEIFPEVNEYRKDLDNMNANVVAEPSTLNQNDVPEKKQRVMKSMYSGRFVVADESIARNEVIMIEEAFAFVPNFDEARCLLSNMDIKTIRNVCDNCGERDIVEFPCNSCQNVFYCTPRCREQHSPIHSIECNAYKIRLFPHVGDVSYLALRCLLVVFDSLLEELKNQRKDNARPLERAEQLWPLILNTARDGELMGLCTNYEVMKLRNPEEFVQHTWTATLLLQYLSRKSLCFQNTRSKRFAIMRSESEWEIIVTALLLRLTSQMMCNAHYIGSVVLRERFVAPTIPAGHLHQSIVCNKPFLAIHPRMSLYNHSCEPNFREKYVKNKMYVVATKNLAKGDQIFHCYGDLRFDPYHIRRTFLKLSHGFTCHCEQCWSDNDAFYFQFKHIICNGDGCNTAYVPDKVAGNRCHVCLKKYDEQFYSRIIQSARILEESVGKYEYLSDLYMEMNRYLPRNSFLRYGSALNILESFNLCGNRSITSNENITRRLLNIAIELLEICDFAEWFPLGSFISASLGLDILALRKINGLERTNTEFDLMKIKRAMDVLSPRLRHTFQKYFDAYAN